MNMEKRNKVLQRIMKDYIGACPICNHVTVLRGSSEWVFRQCSKCGKYSRVEEWDFEYFTKFSQMVR
jgi:transcription elongation factor Elf1